MELDYETGYRQQRRAMESHAWTLEHAQRALALREIEDTNDEFNRGAQDALRDFIREATEAPDPPPE